jgi:uncharacterized protein
MPDYKLTLEVSRLELAICRLPPESVIPEWIGDTGFFSLTRTSDELSIVCREDLIPDNVEAEADWRMFRVKGQLDFSLTGILSSLLKLLSEAGIAVFAISTYDTDYLLVKADRFLLAVKILEHICNIEY